MSDHRPRDPAKLKRQARLEASLKENLRRRKAQARARGDPSPSGEGRRERSEEADRRPEDVRPDVDFRSPRS